MEPNEHDRTDGFDVTDINRRKLLQGVGAAGAIGVLGTGSAAARHEDNGPQNKCDCIDDEDTVAWGKYDFECVDYDDEDDECDEWDFVLTEGEDVLDDITVTHTKDDDPSEPITVEYEAVDGYVVTQVCAFGGTDNDKDDDPEEYSSELENNGGNTAAISNLTFCVEEEPDVPPEGQEYWQVDLIYGDPIEDFYDEENDEPITSYNQENRLLQALWSDTPDSPDDFINENTDEYAHCGDHLSIVEEITYDSETSTATATLNPGDCDCEDFDLVSYSAPDSDFNRGKGQELVGSAQGDAPYEGTVETDGDGNCVYTVVVPDGGADS